VSVDDAVLRLSVQTTHIAHGERRVPEAPRLRRVAYFRVSEAAALLGVSDDTVRRNIDAGKLPSKRDDSNRLVVDGVALAEFARSAARPPSDPSGVERSARNRMVGLVTAVVKDRVMAQVEMQCGPHRVVSLMSTEAVDELGLEVGSLAVSVVKASHIIVETPGGMA
jgi:molybdopterin-binding protein